MTIEELISQGESLLASKTSDSLGFEHVPYQRYDEWKRMALMFCQQFYPDHPQLEIMAQHATANNQNYHCQAIVSILKAFKEIRPTKQAVDYEHIVDLIFNHFNRCAQRLKRRHNMRPTIEINDEYDVQDLLEALLKLHFDDVRAEEWTPSYAGGANRIDFLLKEEEIAIEVKMTRDNLKDKEVGEQLIIDIAKYRAHPNCKVLYCFVYDPNRVIRNPTGLTRDLEKLGADFKVKVYIRPED